MHKGCLFSVSVESEHLGFVVDVCFLQTKKNSVMGLELNIEKDSDAPEEFNHKKEFKGCKRLLE